MYETYFHNVQYDLRYNCALLRVREYYSSLRFIVRMRYQRLRRSLKMISGLCIIHVSIVFIDSFNRQLTLLFKSQEI